MLETVLFPVGNDASFSQQSRPNLFLHAFQERAVPQNVSGVQPILALLFAQFLQLLT
jgi:hypothetical protein